MAEERFDPAVLTKAAEDTFTVRRVFGEAYEREGVTVIPVARVAGMIGTGSGGGMGKGTGMGLGKKGERWQPVEDEPASAAGTRNADGEAEGHGGGGGYGAYVKPIGVYVVSGAKVRWEPVLDMNRVILGGQILGAWALGLALAAWALRRR